MSRVEPESAKWRRQLCRNPPQSMRALQVLKTAKGIARTSAQRTGRHRHLSCGLKLLNSRNQPESSRDTQLLSYTHLQRLRGSNDGYSLGFLTSELGLGSDGCIYSLQPALVSRIRRFQRTGTRVSGIRCLALLRLDVMLVGVRVPWISIGSISSVDGRHSACAACAMLDLHWRTGVDSRCRRNPPRRWNNRCCHHDGRFNDRFARRCGNNFRCGMGAVHPAVST
jgi:hypothetical protein